LEISLFNAVLLDATIWLLCLMALLAFAELSVTHPATTYLTFHGLLISARAFAILNGVSTLFSGPTTAAVTHTEISRALMVADLALVTMTCAWIMAAQRRIQPIPQPRPLSLGIIRGVSAIAIPAGGIAILLWSKLPGIASHEIAGAWAASNWAVIMQTWAGLSLLALIYWYGFKPFLTLFVSLYLAFVIYQGAFRFRLIIPLILLVQLYVDRRGRRWPTLSSALVLLVGAVLFFPLKEIGQELQTGASMESVWQTTREEVSAVFSGNHPDQTILDQFASTLTLADQRGKLFWGRTYSGLLTVIVPRQLWPEKPGLADFEKEISTRERPMAEDGMVITMLGEFYLNFSYAGVVILSFAVAYATGMWFQAAYRRGYFTLARFMYLLLACNFLQIYRDGLISLFVFLVINMMPLTVIVLIHLFSRSELDVSRSPILTTPRIRPRADEQPMA
jgi:hypothetical protein